MKGIMLRIAMGHPISRSLLFLLVGLLGSLMPATNAAAQTPVMEVENSTGTMVMQVMSDGALRLPIGVTAGHVLTSDAGGYGTWQAPPSSLMLPYTGSASATSGAVFQVTNTASSGQTYGVYGKTDSPNGTGVYGEASDPTGGLGVQGEAASSIGIGVYGFARASSGTTYGVYGQVVSSSGYAGYFLGDVHVSGTLSKGGGSFKIDHPLDPENRYLAHSFVESPDMMNVYNGTVTLDAAGEAVVDLPAYFEALNRDFRYQLTCIGGFGPVYIAEEVRGNRFRIAGGAPGMKVSWQVTGIRQDPWAEQHRIVVEEEKASEDRGSYLHPKVYGRPLSQGVRSVRLAQEMRRRSKREQERR